MKAGFISLTKTGHTSISKMLYCEHFPQFCSEWLVKGKQQYLKDSGQLKDYDFLFSSIRHPVDRFISSYKECQKTYGYNKTIFEFLEDYQQNNLSEKQMWHTQAQSFHLIQKDLNFIVKLENFEKDMTDLYIQLGLKKKPQIVWRNKSKIKIPDLSKTFKQEIEDVFQECMNQFNY